MTNLVLTSGDLERPLSGVCTSNGAPADLTVATAVSIHILRADRTTIVRAASTTDLPNGAWTLAWVGGDLTVAGTYTVEVEVMWPGNRPQTFPGGTFTVRTQIA